MRSESLLQLSKNTFGAKGFSSARPASQHAIGHPCALRCPSFFAVVHSSMSMSETPAAEFSAADTAPESPDTGAADSCSVNAIRIVSNRPAALRGVRSDKSYSDHEGSTDDEDDEDENENEDEDDETDEDELQEEFADGMGAHIPGHP